MFFSCICSADFWQSPKDGFDEFLMRRPDLPPLIREGCFSPVLSRRRWTNLLIVDNLTADQMPVIPITPRHTEMMIKKRGRPRKQRISEGQIAFDEMEAALEYWRNIRSGLICVRWDEERLLNPAGKLVTFRPDLYEKIDFDFWRLTEIQRQAIDRFL